MQLLIASQVLVVVAACLNLSYAGYEAHSDYPDYKETDRRYDYQHEDHDPSYFRIVPDYIPKPNDYDSDSHHEDHAYDPNTYEYEGKHKKYGDHQKDHGQYKEYHVSYHV